MRFRVDGASLRYWNGLIAPGVSLSAQACAQDYLYGIAVYEGLDC